MREYKERFNESTAKRADQFIFIDQKKPPGDAGMIFTVSSNFEIISLNADIALDAATERRLFSKTGW